MALQPHRPPRFAFGCAQATWLAGHEERTMPTRRRNKHSPAPRYWPWVLVGLWLLACVLGPRQLHAMPSLAKLAVGVDQARLGPAPTPSCVTCR